MITNTKIKEGVKLIAEFDIIPELSDCYEYYEQFDWLIPVVEKIEDLGFRFEIALNEVNLYDIIDEKSHRFSTTVNIEGCNGYKDKSLTKLQSIFIAVVEFI